MLKKNDEQSILNRTAWDIYCINCNSYLGSTIANKDHRYERGGVCPYCQKNIDIKEEDK